MLPVRRTRVASDEVEALAAAQPERGPYVQTRGGAFQGRLSERSDGTVAVQREGWRSQRRDAPASPETTGIVSASS